MFNMSFRQFFNNPDSITNDLNSFSQNMQNLNSIREELEKFNNYNLEVLNNPSNIPTPPSIPNPDIVDKSKGFMDLVGLSGLKDSINSVLEPLETIQSFLDYILHPSKIFMLLWHWTLEYSYIICLLICVAAVLLYILGYKKTGKWIPFSIVVYTIIRALGSVFQ